MQIELLIASAEPELASRFDAADAIRCRVQPPERVLAAACSPCADVVLLDTRPSAPAALALLKRVRQFNPAVAAMLLVHGHLDEIEVKAARAGALGCLQSASPASLWVKAVTTVHAGECWFSRHAMWHLLAGQISRPIEHLGAGSAGQLTRREREILDLIGSGLSNKEIARRLAISDKTVKTHLHRTYVKLHQSGRYKAFLAQPAAALAPAPRRPPSGLDS